MPVVRVTKEFHFEMAHALWNYDGPCRNIHGHSYRLLVTVCGQPMQQPGHPKNGMLLDFYELKKIVKSRIIDVFDHSLVVYRDTPGDFLNQVHPLFDKLHMVDFQPTCENLVAEMASVLQNALPEGIALHSLRLYETATAYAEWFAVDNAVQE